MELQSQMAKVGQLLKCVGVVVAKTFAKIFAHFLYIVVLLKIQGLDDRSQMLVNLMYELRLQKFIVNIL